MQAAAAAAVNGAGDVQKPQHQPQPVVVGAPPPHAVVPPHWVAMPFAPPPGVVMQPHHQMAPAPAPHQFAAAAHFVPFHAVAAPPPPPPRAAPPVPAVALGSPAPHLQQAGHEENKTVWVGDLHYWMDENYLHSCFGYTGELMLSLNSASQLKMAIWMRSFVSKMCPARFSGCASSRERSSTRWCQWLQLQMWDWATPVTVLKKETGSATVG